MGCDYMIGIKDIITAINNLLKENFPDVKRQSTDIRQGYARPCFYVEMDRDMAYKLNTQLKEKTVSIRIYYFPTTEYDSRVELLDMQDKLENIFLEGVWITPSFFMPTFQQDGQDNGLDFVIVDGILQMQFYLYSIQEIPDTTKYEPLENLYTNIKRKE
jgi:hypothetical protein